MVGNACEIEVPILYCWRRFQHLSHSNSFFSGTGSSHLDLAYEQCVVGCQSIPLDLIGHSWTLDPIWVDLSLYIDFSAEISRSCWSCNISINQWLTSYLSTCVDRWWPNEMTRRGSWRRKWWGSSSLAIYFWCYTSVRNCLWRSREWTTYF